MQQIAFIVGKWTLVCLLLLLPGCDEQVGRFTVSQRTSQQLGGGGRIDFFWGKAIGGSAASDGELLLVFVSYAEERHFTEILENSGDGRVVSTLNLTSNASSSKSSRPPPIMPKASPHSSKSAHQNSRAAHDGSRHRAKIRRRNVGR